METLLQWHPVTLCRIILILNFKEETVASILKLFHGKNFKWNVQLGNGENLTKIDFFKIMI